MEIGDTWGTPQNAKDWTEIVFRFWRNNRTRRLIGRNEDEHEDNRRTKHEDDIGKH